jgi:hypothetical protein
MLGPSVVSRCPRCRTEQGRSTALLLLNRRTTCSSCGVRLRVHGYALANAVVRAGVSMLPVTLFLAWAMSAWWLLLLPALWWVALVYLLLPWKR